MRAYRISIVFEGFFPDNVVKLENFGLRIVWYNVLVTRAPDWTHVCLLTEKRIDPTLARITGAL